MVVTLYLISAVVYNAVDAPRARGFSNIEVWMLGAQFPILLALSEYGFVLYLKKHANKGQNQVQTLTTDPNQVQIMTTDPNQVQTMTSDKNQIRTMTLDQTMTYDQNQVQSMTPDDHGAKLDDRIKRLDSATMIFSFLFFTTFALVYWITLLT